MDIDGKAGGWGFKGVRWGGSMFNFRLFLGICNAYGGRMREVYEWMSIVYAHLYIYNVLRRDATGLLLHPTCLSPVDDRYSAPHRSASLSPSPLHLAHAPVYVKREGPASESYQPCLCSPLRSSQIPVPSLPESLWHGTVPELWERGDFFFKKKKN
jgi:hypothetical protein